MLMNFYHFGCSILSFLFVVPKETSSSSDFRISNSSLDDYFLFICGLEAATKTKSSSSKHVKTERCDPSPWRTKFNIYDVRGTSKGLRFSCLGFWVKGFMCWLVQVAKSFLKTSFFDLSLVSIAHFFQSEDPTTKKKGLIKGSQLLARLLSGLGMPCSAQLSKKMCFFFVGWGEVYLKYPSIWS